MKRSLDIWQLYYVTTPKIKTRYDFKAASYLKASRLLAIHGEMYGKDKQYKL